MSESATPSTRSRLLRELYVNRTGLLFLMTALAAVGLFAVAARTHGSASIFWMTLATGIVATAAYAAFSVLLTTRQFDSFLRTTIEQSVDEHIAHATEGILDTIRLQQRTYVPTSSYAGTDFPDATFNRDLNRSLAASERYFFQGITARYSVARLASIPISVDHVRIIVADPTKPESVVDRAKHDIDDDQSAANIAAARAKIIDDIWMSIVGAYLIRRKSDRIEFCLLADPPIDRAEIFDHEMFLTRYSDPSSGTFRFPASCRFPRDSLIYQMYWKDCARLFTSPYTTRFEIPRDNNPAALLRTLGRAGLDLDEPQYVRFRDKFLKFKEGLPGEIMT